jgi:hypothetical protein
VTTPAPSSLDTTALAHRLRDLAGDERNVQVDFLLHLAEFDHRRAYLDAGYGSLWDYLLKALHLREGAAGRRIAAMKVLRRFPRLEPALRDGRLCLSTLTLLGQVLTEENADEVVLRAAYQTKAEVDHLVASIRPRAAPREGVRKLPEPREGERAPIPPEPQPAEPAPISPTPFAEPSPSPLPLALAAQAPAFAEAPRQTEPERPSAEIRAVSKDRWSLRVTIDGACKEELETLKMLLSHKLPGGELAAVLREAIRSGIEKHGKRKGAVPPARARRQGAKPVAAATDLIPADLKRAVWKRDGGCCAFVGTDGRRCGSRWQLEYDHLEPVALGGITTLDTIRLACRAHNFRYAEEVYGREYMARFRRVPDRTPRSGELTIAGGSDSA